MLALDGPAFLGRSGPKGDGGSEAEGFEGRIFERVGAMVIAGSERGKGKKILIYIGITRARTGEAGGRGKINNNIVTKRRKSLRAALVVALSSDEILGPLGPSLLYFLGLHRVLPRLGFSRAGELVGV